MNKSGTVGWLVCVCRGGGGGAVIFALWLANTHMPDQHHLCYEGCYYSNQE